MILLIACAKEPKFYQPKSATSLLAEAKLEICDQSTQCRLVQDAYLDRDSLRAKSLTGDSVFAVPIDSITSITRLAPKSSFPGLGLTALLITAFVANSLTAYDQHVYHYSRSSCPYVWLRHDTGFVLTAEMITGALAKSLRYRDAVVLPRIQPKPYFELAVGNVLPEIHYIDAMEVYEVKIDSTWNLAVTPEAKTLAYSTLYPIAWSAGNADSIEFKLVHNQSNRNEQMDSAYLLLNTQNTVLADKAFADALMFKEKNWEQWQEAMDVGGEIKEAFLKRAQLAFLHIDGFDGKSWKPLASLHPPGPAVAREWLVPLEIKGIEKIRIAAPPGIWRTELKGYAKVVMPVSMKLCERIEREVDSPKSLGPSFKGVFPPGRIDTLRYVCNVEPTKFRSKNSLQENLSQEISNPIISNSVHSNSDQTRLVLQMEGYYHMLPRQSVPSLAFSMGKTMALDSDYKVMLKTLHRLEKQASFKDM